MLVVIVLAVLLSSGLGIITPFLTQAAFDRALFPIGGGPVDLPLLGWLVAGMVAIPVVSALIGVYQTYQTTLLGNRVMADLRGRLFEHLQRMDLSFFTATRTGAIQSRLANDVGGVQSVLSETASSILGNVVTVAAALVAMVLLSWQLTLVAVALVPLFVLLQVRVGRVRRVIAGHTQESLSDMTAITEESLSVSGVLLAKVFNRQAYEVARYREENARQVAAAGAAGDDRAVVLRGRADLPRGHPGAGLPGRRLPHRGRAAGRRSPPGTIVAFTTLQTRLLFPTVNLLRISLDVQTSLALFRRIFDYLDLRPLIVDAPDARELDTASVDRAGAAGGRLVRLSAGARGGRRPRSARPRSRSGRSGTSRSPCEPGQLAAIVGPSGSGKTTISYLIPRLYDVDRGRVLHRRSGRARADPGLGGRGDRHGHPGHLPAAHHGPGQPALRPKPDATQAEIEEAARAANIHDRILSFAEGYDTWSASAATGCPAVRSSGWPSPGCCCRTRAS